MTIYQHLCDPSHFVDPDPLPIPSSSAFKRCSAHRLCPDDLVKVGKEVYRVKTKQLDKSSPTMIFCLWPVRGGMVEVVHFSPRRQVLAVLQDTEGRTKRLPPII
jgi:hypothetical protein